MKCLECQYFDERNSNGTGLCRARPPRPTGICELSDNRLGEWPTVNGHKDWCGEFYSLDFPPFGSD